MKGSQICNYAVKNKHKEQNLLDNQIRFLKG